MLLTAATTTEATAAVAGATTTEVTTEAKTATTLTAVAAMQ